MTIDTMNDNTEEGTEVTEALITMVEDGSSSLTGTIGSAADISVASPVSLQDVQRAITEYGKAAERFEFGKASVIVDEFRIANLSVTSNPQEVALEKLLTALSRIADCDSKYYPLTFVVQKTRSMFRKDTGGLRNAYMNIAISLKNSVNQLGSDFPVGAHLLLQWRQYVLARVEMIKFYESVTSYDCIQSITWSTMKTKVSSVADDLSACHHPDLSPVSHLLQEEVWILKQLISAQMHISNCKMFDSLLQLKDVRERFDFWIKEVGSLNQTSIGFFARLKGAEPLPRNRLIFWLIKFYDLLMAKFSLYFTDVLGAFCSEEDLRNIHMIDNKYNFIDEFGDFLRRSGASLVAIVMDRSEDSSDFYGFGYHRLENRFTSGESMEPLRDLPATVPYVFKKQVSEEGHKTGQPQLSDVFHADIAKFIECFEPKDRPASTEEKREKEKNLLQRWYHPSEARCVTGDHVEGSLFIAIVFHQQSPGMESRGDVAAFVRHMQHVLRGSALFTELKAVAK